MRNYNLESVEEMAGGDQDFIKVVVQTFLEETPPDLEGMNQAIIEIIRSRLTSMLTK